MRPVYKIALIQLHPIPGAIAANYQRAADFIRQGASQGAHLAVLPEYHLTNWVPDDPAFFTAAGQWHVYLERYRQLAQECQINIVPGTMMVEESARNKNGEDDGGGGADDDETEDRASRLRNVAYFISSQGEVLGHYQKKNLWHPERAHFTSSGSAPHQVIQTALGPVGLLICWDLAFPEAFRELIANGAKMIIIPTAWSLRDCGPAGRARNPRSEALLVESALTCRAFENTCAVVFVNTAGPAAEDYLGLSQVTVPFLGPIGRIDGCAEEMRLVDLDMSILDEAEETYRVRADLASEDWHYHYRPGR
ncbi:MAG: hypothetical protein M1826_001915 [Phylliscum demangeonii]|nr:MAG: hypothetical protein M1826_001915 [Phylliscum demangeonii]